MVIMANENVAITGFADATSTKESNKPIPILCSARRCGKDMGRGFKVDVVRQ
jgi:hypothetical protein